MCEKLRTFTFVDKNSSAVVIISEYSPEKARLVLNDVVRHPNDFRLETTEDEEN